MKWISQQVSLVQIVSIRFSLWHTSNICIYNHNSHSAVNSDDENSYNISKNLITSAKKRVNSRWPNFWVRTENESQRNHRENDAHLRVFCACNLINDA